MVNNMGTMIFLHALYPLTILLELAMRKCTSCSKRIKRKQKDMNRSLYWSSLLIILFESYAVVTICCLIGLHVIGFETAGMALQSSICIIYFIFFLTVPFAMICYVAYIFTEVESKEVVEKFGHILKSLDTKRRGRIVLLQPTWFLLRRLTLSIAVVIFYDKLIVQVYLVVAQIIIQVIIYGYARPFKDSSRVPMELFNEVILMCLLYTMICFTAWIQNIEMKFNIGFVSIAVVGLH